LFIEVGFGGAVNPGSVKGGFERKIPAGLWANRINSAGLFIIGNRHKKGTGSSFVRLGNPAFVVIAKPAIVSLYNFIYSQAEETRDFAYFLGIIGKPHLGAAFAAPAALKTLPLGVCVHNLPFDKFFNFQRFMIIPRCEDRHKENLSFS
jgi:hypothetical protein